MRATERRGDDYLIRKMREEIEKLRAEKSNALANLAHADEKIGELQRFIAENHTAALHTLTQQRDEARAALEKTEEGLHVAEMDYSGRRDAYDKGQVGWMINSALAIRMKEARDIALAALPRPIAEDAG